METLTFKHFAEVSRVHGHDDVGLGVRLAPPCTTRAALQVQEPNTRVFSCQVKKKKKTNEQVRDALLLYR